MAYRAMGVPIIPVCPPDHRLVSENHLRSCQSPGKMPLIRGWQRYCSTLPNGQEVRSWAKSWPNANVGGPTGPLLGVGLDIDPRHGGDTAFYAYLQEHGTTIPDTWMSLTGGGGLHHIFAWPQGQDVRNSGEGGLLTGVDVRGDGGYLVLPPSVHVSGGGYAWEVSSHPRDIERAECPGWLLALIASKQAGERTASPGTIISGPVPRGARNAHLTSLAGVLRRRGCDEAVILAALHAENDARCEPPLPGREVENIARSVSRYAPGVQQNLSETRRLYRLPWPRTHAIRPLKELLNGDLK